MVTKKSVINTLFWSAFKIKTQTLIIIQMKCYCQFALNHEKIDNFCAIIRILCLSFMLHNPEQMKPE